MYNFRNSLKLYNVLRQNLYKYLKINDGMSQLFFEPDKKKNRPKNQRSKWEKDLEAKQYSCLNRQSVKIHHKATPI